MEETFFLNVGFNETETHREAKTKTRIWPALISFNNWIMKNPVPGIIADGAGVTLLTNCSIAIEGLITDLLEEYIQTLPAETRPAFNADYATWKIKKPLYNRLFSGPLEQYPHFETVNILIAFRNNLVHGRSHDEVVRTEHATGQKGSVESENNSYQAIREFLVRKRLLQAKDVPSNSDYLWKYQTACMLVWEVKQFLKAIIKNHDPSNSVGIARELEYALQNTGTINA